MAIPQANQNPNIRTDNPYQHLGKERSSAPGWSWKLFNFSVIILIIVIVIFLGIQIGYKPFLNSQISKLDSQLEDFENKILAKDQTAFINFYSQAVHLEEILDSHIFFSPFFELLEANTHSDVFFTDIDYEFSENRISLDGRAASFEALGQQLERFDGLTEIDRSILAESKSSEGEIRFKFLVFPSKELFTASKLNGVSSQPEPDTDGSSASEADSSTNSEAGEGADSDSNQAGDSTDQESTVEAAPDEGEANSSNN